MKPNKEAQHTVDGFADYVGEIMRRARQMEDAFYEIPRQGRWLRVKGRGRRPWPKKEGSFLVKCDNRPCETMYSIILRSKNDLRECGEPVHSTWWGHLPYITHVWVPLPTKRNRARK